VCVLKVEGISCLKEVLSFFLGGMVRQIKQSSLTVGVAWRGLQAAEKRLEDVKKPPFLLKNAV